MNGGTKNLCVTNYTTGYKTLKIEELRLKIHFLDKIKDKVNLQYSIYNLQFYSFHGGPFWFGPICPV